MKEFKGAVFSFPNFSCDICTKMCYSVQIKEISLDTSNCKNYLPNELKQRGKLYLCYRCRIHLASNKKVCPSNAYWNNLDPGILPEELLPLSQAEQRLLSRIIPFMKIVKLSGRFGQYGIRGQAILFAMDLFEVIEKLPTMLPRSSSDTGLVIVREYLQDCNQIREFSISRHRVLCALQWLIQNNPLYKDVKIDPHIQLNANDIFRELQSKDPIIHGQNDAAHIQVQSFVPIGEHSRIIRAAWNQSDTIIFNPNYAGVQCCAMAVSNLVRAAISPPNNWNTNIINENMIEGDNLYAAVRNSNQNVPDNGYLNVRHFDTIKHNFVTFNKTISIEYDTDSAIFGSLKNSENNATIGVTLYQGLEQLFSNHSYGILTTAQKSYGLILYDNKFYFTDSHSCGPKGSTASNGKACIIQCDNIHEFYRICRRATGSRNIQYTIDYINVIIHEDGGLPCNDDTQQNSNSQHIPGNAPDSNADVSNNTDPETLTAVIKSYIMTGTDSNQPDVEDILQVSQELNKIVRKTTDNIVNEAYELKAEELAWYFLFPFGINGFRQDRPVSITPLDYYQTRILSKDKRFQRNDYLFYALSMYEYHRIKSTIAACGKKIENADGQIEDVHLYVKKLRGSAAYWRSAMAELIAQIRCLGPPQYFVTFSCNDLHWPDMKQALLIADGRPHEEPTNMDILATQELIEKYPLVVSRHFMIRVAALVRAMKKYDSIFGGKLIDYWWRIEFQMRGSPHLHMVVWLENYPEFDSPEGIDKINQVCSCGMPSKNSELHRIVNECQIHRHSDTCHKNSRSDHCRFAFPRAPCIETKIIAHLSEDFLKSGGRMCLLKRKLEERWINNYNPILLAIWQGNMDIQPCGNNEAIAFYVAKYLTKSEPTDMSANLRDSIKLIQKENSAISKKLFKICMNILKLRQTSACECIYRLCHLRMRQSSRICIFINTRKPEQRYRMLKFNQQGHATGYHDNIFIRYENRPLQHEDYEFASMSLLEFAMLFEPYYTKNKEFDDANEDLDEDVLVEDQNDQVLKSRVKLITLQNNTKMKIRNIPAVVRVPYFKADDPHNFYYSLLLQYLPFRKESDLLANFNSAQEAFLANEEHLLHVNTNMKVYRERDQQLENAFTKIHAFEILDTEAEQIYEPEEDILADDQYDHDLNEEDFNRSKNSMNICQKKLFNYITENIKIQLQHPNDSSNPTLSRLKIFITGGAGTGKTFVLKVLKTQINKCYGKKAVKVAALTGVAARLVGGTTLHSLLKLPVQKDGKIINLPLLTGIYLQTMRLIWKDTEFIFIDEISMIPYEILSMVDSRLRQVKNNDGVFGGINVLLFGDLLQLPPIRGNPVFKQPVHMEPATDLWHLFSVCELVANMRQAGDDTFVNLLNALRVGELTSDHLQILICKTNSEEVVSVEDVIRIYPTNAQVAAHNERVLNHFRKKGTEMFTITAQDTIVDSTRKMEGTDLALIIPTDINKTGGLPREITIFVGAKVMLRSNIDISKGLVNGAMGYITEIVWPYFRRGQLYEKDIPSVRIDFGADGTHLIAPKSIQFPAKFSYGTAERRMLPIVLSWASTAHKLQGSTVDKAVVYLGKKLFQEGQAYVTLSRVRSLDGVFIEELDCEKLVGTKPCNIPALQEMMRLRTLPKLF